MSVRFNLKWPNNTADNEIKKENEPVEFEAPIECTKSE